MLISYQQQNTQVTKFKPSCGPAHDDCLYVLSIQGENLNVFDHLADATDLNDVYKQVTTRFILAVSYQQGSIVLHPNRPIHSLTLENQIQYYRLNYVHSLRLLS